MRLHHHSINKEEKNMQHNYSYQSTLAASERIGWKVEDIIADGFLLFALLAVYFVISYEQ
jgi:hypothetical protein